MHVLDQFVEAWISAAAELVLRDLEVGADGCRVGEHECEERSARQVKRQGRWRLAWPERGGGGGQRDRQKGGSA